MRNILIISIGLIVVLFASVCLAQIEIEAEVDKQKISTDEAIIYKLTISSRESLPEPKLPEFKGFIIASQANTSKVVIKGQGTKIVVIYVFILIPREVGKITIEPAEISTKTGTYKSESFEIEVVPGERKIEPEIPPGPKEKVIL